MAFSVQEMKSSIASDGFLKASSYEMVVAPPVGGGELLRIRAESVSLPGSSFASVDAYKPFGSGLTYQIPHTFTPQEISVTHLIDANSDILKTLIDWSSSIVNFKGVGRGGRGATANYFKDYVVDASIFLYSNDGKKQKTITLFQMYPSTIDQVQMSWASSDEIAKVNVSYQFVNYTIS
jgi:hypothetical protein